MRAELFDFLVQCKTRWFSGDFEEHAARLAEIDGMKISAIDYWSDVVAEIDEMLPPLKLFAFVFRSKRDVMY